jgi:hypothetical protein
MKTDVLVGDHGSVCMVTPMSPAAREWVDENVSLESWQWLGTSFSCEPRYVTSLIEGMQEDGLTVEF